MQQNVSNYKVRINARHGVKEDRLVSRIHVCMGVASHTGSKFTALCEWSNRRYDKTIITIADSLQRHNLAYEESLNEEEAYRRSLSMGQEWLDENHEALSLVDNLHIVRWDDWLSHSDFERNHDIVMKMYHNNEKFKLETQKRALGMWEKKHKENPKNYSINRKEFFIQQSIIYLLEETAIFPIMFEEEAVDIYAGSWFSGLLSVLEACSFDKMAQTLRDVACSEVDFLRRKNKQAV